MDCFATLAMTFEWNRLFLGVALAEKTASIVGDQIFDPHPQRDGKAFEKHRFALPTPCLEIGGIARRNADLGREVLLLQRRFARQKASGVGASSALATSSAVSVSPVSAAFARSYAATSSASSMRSKSALAISTSSSPEGVTISSVFHRSPLIRTTRPRGPIVSTRVSISFSSKITR